MNLTHAQHMNQIHTLATLALAQAMLWQRQAKPIAHLRRTQASVSNMRAHTGNPHGTRWNCMAEAHIVMQLVHECAAVQVTRRYVAGKAAVHTVSLKALPRR